MFVRLQVGQMRNVSYRRPRCFALSSRHRLIHRGTDNEEERLERSWHWTSFLSHVASEACSSLTSTSRRKQERRCDLRLSSRHGLINVRFLSCGICPV